MRKEIRNYLDEKFGKYGYRLKNISVYFYKVNNGKIPKGFNIQYSFHSPASRFILTSSDTRKYMAGFQRKATKYLYNVEHIKKNFKWSKMTKSDIDSIIRSLEYMDSFIDLCYKRHLVKVKMDNIQNDFT